MTVAAAAARANCASCSHPNRSVAKYCKRCGTIIDTETTDDLLGKLVGLSEVRAVLEDLRATVAGMRRNGQEPKLPFNTLITGNTGTAKSLIGTVIASVLFKEGVVKEPKVVTVDALIPDAITLKDVESKFNSARGGVLFIDNGHKLFSAEGSPTPVFSRLVTLIQASPLGPVLILAGLPFGIAEFLKNPENFNLIGRFQNVFRIEDYPPTQLLEIATHALGTQGLIITPQARERLDLRFRWLYRKQKAGDSSVTTLNGHLAMREATAVQREYYKRGGVDRTVLPEDVKGDVEKRKGIDDIMAELESFIGMLPIKKEIRALYDDVSHARALSQRGLGGRKSFAYHFTITGNPGTGKTTIARVLGEIFEALGVLPTGHLVEVHGKDLVAQFQGQTAPLVHAACNRATGGILFIDEAYAMKSSDNDSFGQEAVDTLLKRMEDDQGKYIVIAAGYPREIADFLKSNPGFQSRFLKQFHLEDYSANELTQIFATLAGKQSYSLDDATREAVGKVFADMVARKTRLFANGREARNLLLGPVLRKQAERIRRAGAALTDSEVMRISAEDIPEVGAGGAEALESALAKLNALTGLGGVKAAVRNIQNTLKAKRLMGDPDTLSKHFVFTGGPGTGKTTVARIIADVFFGLGLLPTRTLVEVAEKDIVKGFVGQTAPNMDAICDKALGGVLFIDEAYSLVGKPGPGGGSGGGFGQEAIDTLLKRMEDDRGKFIVVVAGYKAEMRNFIDANPGLKSRFTNYIEFEDYLPVEQKAIFDAMAKAKPIAYEQGFDEVLLKHFERTYAARGKDFANARDVRQLFDRACEACATRVVAMNLGDEASREQLRSLKIADLGVDSADAATTLKSAKERLDRLVGLGGVKAALASIQSTLRAKRLMGDPDLLAKHFVFTGGPGTGKTTVARILADVFYGQGLLPTNTLVEVDKSRIVMPYQGQTAPNMNALCDKAMGGILFIDEAYALVGDQYGKEAIETLLKRMEDDRGKFIVVVAGYKPDMKTFIDSNPGFESRFTNYIDFDDYKPVEMKAIFDALMKGRGLASEPGLDVVVLKHFERLYMSRGKNFANARDVRKFFDRAFERCAERAIGLNLDEAATREQLRTLRIEDLGVEGVNTAVTLEAAMAKLHGLVGLSGVKSAVAGIQSTLKAKRLMGDPDLLARHFVFTGNPGTGKTTVARILADIFHAIGLLPGNTLVEVDRGKIVMPYVGQTAPNMNALCDRAMGGILFIDEAYTLAGRGGASNDFGPEAIDALLKRMEDDRGKFIVIVAGYKAEMRRFIEANTGLKSRFSSFIDFEDYAPAEMHTIFGSLMKSKGLTGEPGFDELLRQHFDARYQSRGEDFGNAREVRQLFEKTFEQCAMRVSALDLDESAQKEALRVLRAVDLPLQGS